jgi:DNA-binding MarR family transcriptional regulator
MTSTDSGQLPRQASGCTCFKLRSLSRRVTQLYDRALAPSGLKVTQYSLIANARRREASNPPTVTELAQKLVTDRTTLTRNLKPLVDAGYIKVGSGADERSKAVSVTAKGEAAYQAARPLWSAAQGLMRARVGERDLAALHDLIDSILPELDESGIATN